MRAATLFSGIGAPEQAMPGWQWLWHAEIEPFPAAVMAARHPGSINLGDVLADDFAERAERAGRPDVLVFGSPCQSFSVAGKRLGLSDPRGNLALVALALVRRLRPSWFVFENVPGLLSSERGDDFEAFLGAVAESGYSGCWRVLDARYWHVAQTRERVFFVGSLGDWRGPAAVLSLAEGMRGHPPSRGEARQDVAASLTRGADSSGRGGYAGRRREDDVNLVAEVAPTLPARTKAGGGLGTDFDCDGGLIAGTVSCIKGAAIGREPENGPQYSEILSDGSCYTLNCTEAHAVAHAFNWQSGGDCRGLELRDITMALSREQTPAVAMNLRGREGGAMPEMSDLASLRAASGGSSRSYVAATQVRRLTPRECERLQGFPDDFTLIPYPPKWADKYPDRVKYATDGARYRACGNSMAVPCVRWILSRIEAQAQAQDRAA